MEQICQNVLWWYVTRCVCCQLDTWINKYLIDLIWLTIACNTLCGIRPTGILLMCPSHQSLHSMISSSIVDLIRNDCLMALFLIFCSPEILSIFHCQLSSAVKIFTYLAFALSNILIHLRMSVMSSSGPGFSIHVAMSCSSGHNIRNVFFVCAVIEKHHDLFLFLYKLKLYQSHVGGHLHS